MSGTVYLRGGGGGLSLLDFEKQKKRGCVVYIAFFYFMNALSCSLSLSFFLSFFPSFLF